MKLNIINSLFLGACVVSLASCSENSWNNHLDGFEGDNTITDVQTVDYTLTSTDYSTIAGLAANKALAGDDGAAALKAVGTAKAFSEKAQARTYVPAFLSDASFPYFTLTDGSAVRLTYNETVGVPEQATAMAGASTYTVTDADYQTVWGSGEDYTASFSPKHTAAASLPGVLKKAFASAQSGDYVVVSYNTSNVDPVFTQTPTPTFTLGSTIGTAKKGETIEISAIVTAQSTNGLILTDKTGSIFAYWKSGFNAADYPIGSQVVSTAVISSYNKGLQVDAASSTFQVLGKEAVTYPAPKVFDLAALTAAKARTTDELAVYGSVTGKVIISGNNINIDLGSTDVYGGVYFAPAAIKAKLVADANVTVTGYFIAIAGGRYCNFVATDVTPVASTAAKAGKSRVVAVPSVSENAIYTYNGSSWAPVADACVLSPADYTAMGATSGTLSNTSDLPKYLMQKFPYAQAEATKYVVYNTSSGLNCIQYVYNGTEWVANNGVQTVTAQFVKNKGQWMYDPNVTITLPAGRNQPLSTEFYQACVNWVYENIDKPLGSTSITSGVGYVTKYGNNDYYCGASAYQGNVDLRASSAVAQYPKGYEGMSDDEIVNLLKTRFCEQVLPAALSTIYPDVAPIEGLDVIYTINFYAYNGKTTDPYTATYQVVGKGQFKYLSCTWFNN